MPWKAGVIVPRESGRGSEVSLVLTIEVLDERCSVVKTF
jgi:hypothetical protein